MSGLTCAYIGRDDARTFIRAHHRHHPAPQGAILYLGCWLGEQLVGVAVLGRPVSRVEQAAGAWELTRLATDGTEHACSKLYGYARRVHQLLAGKGSRLITYTLPEEGGASLRGAGWALDGVAKGRDWAACSRRQEQRKLFDRGPLAPTVDKLRWVAP